jgi:hypothetical protein
VIWFGYRPKGRVFPFGFRRQSRLHPLVISMLGRSEFALRNSPPSSAAENLRRISAAGQKAGWTNACIFFQRETNPTNPNPVILGLRRVFPFGFRRQKPPSFLWCVQECSIRD